MKKTLGAVDGEGCYTGEVKGEEETRQLDEWPKWRETTAWDARWSDTGGIRDWSEERWARGAGEIPGREYRDIEEQVDWLAQLRPRYTGWWQDREGVGERCGVGEGT